MTLLLAAAGCERSPAVALPPSDAGALLEKAAIEAGIIVDPAALDPVGAYANETDRICVTGVGDVRQIGASVEYSERQGCVAHGTMRGRETLQIDFGNGCRFQGRFDGERITFAATLPAACDRRCTGRATLAALATPRLSAAATEGRAMRGPDDKPLCS